MHPVELKLFVQIVPCITEVQLSAYLTGVICPQVFPMLIDTFIGIFSTTTDPQSPLQSSITDFTRSTKQ